MSAGSDAKTDGSSLPTNSPTAAAVPASSAASCPVSVTTAVTSSTNFSKIGESTFLPPTINFSKLLALMSPILTPVISRFVIPPTIAASSAYARASASTCRRCGGSISSRMFMRMYESYAVLIPCCAPPAKASTKSSVTPAPSPNFIATDSAISRPAALAAANEPPLTNKPAPSTGSSCITSLAINSLKNMPGALATPPKIVLAPPTKLLAFSSA